MGLDARSARVPSRAVEGKTAARRSDSTGMEKALIRIRLPASSLPWTTLRVGPVDVEGRIAPQVSAPGPHPVTSLVPHPCPGRAPTTRPG